MAVVRIEFVLWDQPAGVVARWKSRQDMETPVNSQSFSIQLDMEERPRKGLPLKLDGWACGRVEDVYWDRLRNVVEVVVPDIFVDEGSAEQRLTDFRLLSAAALSAGWEAGGAVSRTPSPAMRGADAGKRPNPPSDNIVRRAMSFGRRT